MKRFCLSLSFICISLIVRTLPAQQAATPEGSRHSDEAAAARKPGASNYSQEPFVIEQYYTTARFENDGTSQRDLAVRIKVQSDAGVQQLGEVVFGYNSGNEQMEVRSVRVHKPERRGSWEIVASAARTAGG